MKQLFLKIVAILTLSGASFAAHAQFGSGVVFDPTQSAHALQQIEQGQNIFTNSVKLADNAIATYIRLPITVITASVAPPCLMRESRPIRRLPSASARCIQWARRSAMETTRACS
jgi:hypothetical protein